MAHYQSVTFIIPCRNNLKYLQQAVNSIENYYSNYHQIVILDDASNDGTWEWINSLNKPHIKTYRNESSDRVGHTVLYDIGISLAETPIVTILHSDMVVTKDYVSNMLKNLTPLSVISATRIEPPLHPPGPEKYVKNFGMEPEEFQLQFDEFEKFVEVKQAENKDTITNGIFAPWMLYKEDLKDHF
jgi:glycosyltransferase involved in cell wall biosynthesis